VWVAAGVLILIAPPSPAAAAPFSKSVRLIASLPVPLAFRMRLAPLPERIGRLGSAPRNG